MAVITIPEGTSPGRCDKILSQLLSISRSQVKLCAPYIYRGKILTAHDVVFPGDTIEYQELLPQTITKTDVISLDIIFEDEDIIVVNKPANIAVHPAAGATEKTLVEYLVEYCDLSHLGSIERPGVVHRLDKDTTGCIIFAKSNHAYRSLTKQFAEHSIGKQYTCIVCGSPVLNTGKIEIPIARNIRDRTKMSISLEGKYAKTTWTVRERFQHYTWLNVQILTGRTHQIRVHMSYAHMPIAGDKTYGKQSNHFPFPRIMLHAESLIIQHPRTGDVLTFCASIPQDFTDVIRKLHQEEQ